MSDSHGHQQLDREGNVSENNSRWGKPSVPKKAPEKKMWFANQERIQLSFQIKEGTTRGVATWASWGV